jgi:ClpP class serine protease
MRALDAALNTIWAMEEGSLQTLLTIAARENATTPEAVEAYRAKAMAGTDRARVRDGVAIIDVIGATFKRANLFTAMSGATSYEIIRADFQAALDDPKVKGIMLNIDSPGGEASGTGELAAAVAAARGKKPITAYVGGMGASAGYWLASAADRVVVDPQAILGSIGVQWAMKGDPPENDKTAKTYTFISSQSPLKNADPGTEAGAKQLQSAVDAMAAVFYEAVAMNRGVDIETALNNFGKGGIFVGKDAVKAGLADELGSFESVLAELSAGRKGAKSPSTRNGRTTMSETPEPAAEAAVIDNSKAIGDAVSAALAAERTRTAGLDRIASAHAVDAAVLAKAKEDGTDVATFALAVADLAAAKTKEAGTTVLAALKTDEEAAAQAAASLADEGESDDAIAARIAAA